MVLEALHGLAKLEVISELADLHEEWSPLHDALPCSTPFQSPEWLLTWWKHFGSGQLRGFAFRNEKEALVGVIPCFLHEWNGRRQLTLVGSGISDYLEPLILDSHRASVLQSLGDYLQSNDSWDVCNFQDLSEDSALVDLPRTRGLRVQIEPDLQCSRVPLSGGFDRFWKGRPSGLRRNVKRYRQKAEEISAITFEHANACTAELLEALIRLHNLRWREQGEQGMINANRSGDFVRDICRQFAERQQVLFLSLRFHSEIAAIILAFPYRKEIFAYLSAFDPVYGPLGLGRLLLYESIHYASSRGYSFWNFLRGQEPYKVEWGAQPIRKLRVLVTRGNDSNSESSDTEQGS